MSEINVTPFVDVMLVLLIVFMVTAPLLTVGVPVDLLVVSKEKFDYWSDTPGNVYFEAATEGRTLYEAT